MTDAHALIAAALGAAAQDWSPFVLVAGLLLIGLVADDDGLFAAAGYHLARAARRGSVLFAGAVAMIGVVTAVLNLDTSVAFLTPVLVHAAAAAARYRPLSCTAACCCPTRARSCCPART